MKLTYTNPKITIDELSRADILLVSLMGAAEKNGVDNTKFGVESLLDSIGEDLFGGSGSE